MWSILALGIGLAAALALWKAKSRYLARFPAVTDDEFYREVLTHASVRGDQLSLEKVAESRHFIGRSLGFPSERLSGQVSLRDVSAHAWQGLLFQVGDLQDDIARLFEDVGETMPEELPDAVVEITILVARALRKPSTADLRDGRS